MTEPLRIQVDRARAVCPYCKGEVAGHVWLCPGCDAAHHADCVNEHGRCATCGELTSSAGGRADDRLLKLRSALVTLGFAVVREGPREVVGFHTGWVASAHWRMPVAVHVLRVDTVTPAVVKADLDRLEGDPLAATDTVVLYAADAVDAEAERAVADASTARRLGDRACVASAWSPPSGLIVPQVVQQFTPHASLARQAVTKAFPRQVDRPPPPPPVIVATPRPAPPPVIVATPRPAPPPPDANAPVAPIVPAVTVPSPSPEQTAAPRVAPPAEHEDNALAVGLAIVGALVVAMILLIVVRAAAG